ncbi:MAG: sodium-dependent transporter [Lachnospiraceae bacterium]|nr:sodium-dependent transporter [Lachnospiraceae bacterium]MDY5742550.1 sodium-dependent transporter [Lachnospiraceae bacterium]
MERERLGSRLGFILLSAGCAIGIGNVWKFPYITGQNGGGAFVLIYLFFLFALGIPAMTMEFAMGRASRKSPVRMYRKLARPGTAWGLHGFMALAGNVILMMFYTAVTGWMLRYFVDMLSGRFTGLDTKGIEAHFGDLLGAPWPMLMYTVIVVAVGFAICSIGLQNGLERITKWMMIALIVIMLVLAGNSFFMAGAAEGLRFYLLPDFGRMRAIGIGKVIAAAMNQAFFTLSLGIGSMAIFGSYIGNERSLMGEAVNVAALDTFVAISAGLIIFPACFSYGVEVSSGPSLIFITLPNIFNHIPLGRLWGTLFFLFMFFAAFSTVLAVFENIIACLIDLTGWSRQKVCLIGCAGIMLLSVPCILGFNVWSHIDPFGKGGIQGLEDFIVSNLLLPGGSLIVVLFCITRYGWGWENFVKEANKGRGLQVASWMRPYMTYVLPLIVLSILILGLL